MNQTEQSARDPEDNEVLRYVLSEVTTTPRTQIQISQVGARFIDRETNTSEVEMRPLREEVRIDIDHAHSRGIQVPSSHSELSSHDTNIVEGSSARPCIPNIMPQLDGPLSVHARRRPIPEVRRKASMSRGGHPDESDSDFPDNRSCDRQRHSGRRRHYQDRGGRPPDRENNQDRGYPRRGRPPDDRGPPDDGGPPNDGDPQEMEDCQDDLEDKDHQALLDQCTLYRWVPLKPYSS